VQGSPVIFERGFGKLQRRGFSREKVVIKATERDGRGATRGSAPRSGSP
jgi:hypothetical protein